MVFVSRSATLLGVLMLLAPIPASAAASATSTTHAGAQMDKLISSIDMLWVLIAAALVFVMQIGFLLLEAGAVRTKNAISVAQKNLLDFGFATLVFALVGYGIAFSPAASWLPFGSDAGSFLLSGLAGENTAFFIFQVMFCGTAATIISGAVAERMCLRAYIILCVIMAGIVYPVFTHWAWGAALGPSSGAFLANAGFVDFAGSTVVHATGGWFALAACLILGARDRRFTDGPPVRYSGHSAVLSSAGALFLFVGWIGFNGGSTLALTADVPNIILNTVLAGATGTVLGYGMMWLGGAMLPERAVNGTIGGLVAITAGCHVVGPVGAIILGAVGSIGANMANVWLEKRFRIDDAVGAVGAHGFAGVIGTCGLALVAPLEHLPLGSRIDQLALQATASGLNFLWAFGIGAILITAIKPIVRLRVSVEEEEMGLNAAEHGARLGHGHLEAELQGLIGGQGPTGGRLTVESGDDTEQLSELMNSLMSSLEEAESRRRADAESARDDEESKRFALFGEIASDSILLIHENRIHSANAAAVKLLKVDASALIGRPPADFVEPDKRVHMTKWLESDQDIGLKLNIIDAEGQAISADLRCRQMNLNGHRVAAVRITDLSEREQAEKRMYHLAMHDPLTDLPNRELFKHRLGEAIAGRSEDRLTGLLLIDIDRFKDINDLHGHPSGDTVLVAMADRLRGAVRNEDTVARLGGDEFAIVQTGLFFANQAADLAYRLLQEISRPLTLPSGAVIRPRASIGIAINPNDAEDADTLMQNADVALYDAKKNGRNHFQLYQPQMGRFLRLRQQLEGDLSSALEHGELELYYQPRMNLDTLNFDSYEALIRWRRGEEMVPPADFIPIAEESGLIIPIGSWVIREACRTAMTKLDGAAISVNVSPRQFHDPDLVATVIEAIEESGLEPSRLELEITEGVLVEDDQQALRILSRLHSLGIRIALDDFGTGYSSLSYLTRFSFDTIKIDRSFVQTDEENAWHIVRSVLSLSEGLKTAVVAEGVETVEQLQRLAMEGCAGVQGYLIARPQPAETVPRTAGADIRTIMTAERPVHAAK